MCGIAGFITIGCDELVAGRTIRQMAGTIAHRGPDAQGVWLDAKAGVALGHRRLSIIDLSSEGRQPMVSAGGRYVIVFNGEIYNYRRIRKDLEDAQVPPPSWRGHSDTEVMLAAFEAWNVKRALQSFVGMFAFALWDRRERVLHLVRDRLGEKPLYYGWCGEAFVFGSELKAIRAYPAFQAELDRDATTIFLRHGYIPAPLCIYRGFRKLVPGAILSLPCARLEPGLLPPPDAYWRARDIAERGIAEPFTGSEEEAVSHLEKLLQETISGQMIADVQLGAFLSGGIDSSTIVALMQAQSATPVKTFTIGFNESKYNEAESAMAVARYLGTEHTEMYVTPQDALNVVPRLPEIYDEPFADCSQIPTFLLAQLTRRYVTVSLSGDGGDEVFGGYNRYLQAACIWKHLGCVPRSIRERAGHFVTGIRPGTWDRCYSLIEPLLRGNMKSRLFGDKLHKLAEIFTASSADELYYGLVSQWKQPCNVVRASREPMTILTDRAQWAQLPDFNQRMMFLDTVAYLPDDIMVKVDRASMGVSLEARTPFLDHRIIEFAWTLPLSMKIRDGQGKWILRRVLDRYVPRSLLEKPKMGFGVPIDAWLRGPLREWAEDLLSEKRLSEEGIFNLAPIRDKWQEHLSGRRNWHYYLWNVLMFQAWSAHNSRKNQ